MAWVQVPCELGIFREQRRKIVVTDRAIRELDLEDVVMTMGCVNDPTGGASPWEKPGANFFRVMGMSCRRAGLSKSG